MRCLVALAVLVLGCLAWAPYGGNQDDTTKVKSGLAAALFPEFQSFYDASGGWPDAVLPQIQQLQQARLQRLQSAQNCTKAPSCLLDAVYISSSDNATLYSALQTSSAPPALLSNWANYVNATNRIIRIYGALALLVIDIPDLATANNSKVGLLYADDGPSYNETSGGYPLYVTQLLAWHLAGPPSTFLPPWDAWDFALDLLDGNDRDEAISFPDLWQNQNAAALAKSQSLDWSSYEYAAILVPGSGPALHVSLHVKRTFAHNFADNVSLAPEGKFRVRLAVHYFQQAKYSAPFIITSGGMVHPAATEYAEALEMRNWLIDQHGIDVASLVIEPHARHTTTNLRNSARLLKTLGAPVDKRVLIVSDGSQTASIGNETFQTRNLIELGYRIGKIGPFRSQFAIDWVPTTDSYTIDPRDPLDP